MPQRDNFNPVATPAVDKLADAVLRVETFFADLLQEAPALARTLSVLLVSASGEAFLMQAPNDHRLTYNDATLMRQKKTAMVDADRICIYVGEDNAYDPMGVTLETVLAHEVGHWLDGAGHRNVDKFPQGRQRAECIADAFAALYRLRQSTDNRQEVARLLAAKVKVAKGRTTAGDYTAHVLAPILAEHDHDDALRDAGIKELYDMAQKTTTTAYLRRGRAPRA